MENEMQRLREIIRERNQVISEQKLEIKALSSALEEYETNPDISSNYNVWDAGKDEINS